MNPIDAMVSFFSPTAGLRRVQARKVLRQYQGAEANRLTNHKKPKNQSADQELLGPFGADQMRAWARALVRDNAYAWNVVDTIVSNVIGDGITAQSTYETPAGDDVESINDKRDKVFAEWCEVCDINGEMTFSEIQALCQREIVEAGEVLVRLIKTPSKEYRGIYRPVPLALELIEADRIATEKDNYTIRVSKETGNRIIRGVEVDKLGKPIAYWIYPDHPTGVFSVHRTPERVPASDILHLFRKDRVGQSRGISWFAPSISWMRDLGVYVDNEIQASAVASCFGVAIKSEMPVGSLLAPSNEDTTDANGNRLEYLEPAMVTRLLPGESIESINPGRPNSASEPWINLMLRGICAGTGTNYEAVAKDFSKTSYSSSRSSKLEDRPRNKRWQNYIVWHLCQPVWDEFCNAAARSGVDGFPTSSELLDDRRRAAPVEWQLPEQEWVDPASEQDAAANSIDRYMSTYQDELGSRGRSWRATFYQAAKEKALRQKLGLLTAAELDAQVAKETAPTAQPGVTENVAASALNGAQVASMVEVLTQVGTGAMPKDTAKAVIAAAFPTLSEELIASIIDPIKPGTVMVDGAPQPVEEPTDGGSSGGEWMGLSRLQWQRNRKALADILNGLSDGSMSEALARAQLSMIGLSETNIAAIIADASDGQVDNPLPEEVTRISETVETIVRSQQQQAEQITRQLDAVKSELVKREPPPMPNVVINMPQGPTPEVIVNNQIETPTVNVAVPEQPAPVVNVSVPEQSAPVVNVNVPENKPHATKTTVIRDNNGDIEYTLQEPI